MLRLSDHVRSPDLTWIDLIRSEKSVREYIYVSLLND